MPGSIEVEGSQVRTYFLDNLYEKEAHWVEYSEHVSIMGKSSKVDYTRRCNNIWGNVAIILSINCDDDEL